MGYSADVKEVLSSIKKTEGLKAKIHKEIGIKTATDIESKEDMYEFSYKKEDLDIVNWIILHGNCVDAGTAQLKDWGYTLIRERHFPKVEERWCFVRCNHCGERMCEKTATKLQKSKLEKLRQDREEAEELRQIRREWEIEQILLGNM